jgi:hypothetical protein
MLIHSPIRIYYALYEDRKLVEVVHFWHGSRNEPRRWPLSE